MPMFGALIADEATPQTRWRTAPLEIVAAGSTYETFRCL